MLIDIISSIPSLIVNCVDIVDVVAVGIVIVGVGFIGSIVSNRNI